jgi:hypothetical protein
MAKKSPRLGIIQSRGLGDIVITIPIAGHYHSQGWEVYWPIDEQFLPHVQHHVPWVHWIPIPVDPQGRYFYDVPLERLRNFGCDEIIPLYQHLTGHPFSEEKYFQYTSFDQYKYIRAEVPFLHKWRLDEYITRDPSEEARVFDSLVTQADYCVVHLEGSDHTAEFDLTIIPSSWQTIYIRPGVTSSIFNYRRLLESAQSIVCVDSCMANMVDQLQIDNDLYFIARSHIGLTPVLNSPWTWLE